MAIIPPLAITITARNAASGTLTEVARDAARMGDSVERAAGQAGQSEEALRGVGDAAGSAGDGLRAAADAAEATTAKLSGIRNASAGIALAGAGALALASNLIQVAEEGNAVEARLEAVLKQQQRLNDLQKINSGIDEIAVRGHFDDDDSLRSAVVAMANWEVKTKDMIPLLEAAGRQAQTTGQDVESLANAFGKALATGNYEALKKTAVSFSDIEIAAIKAAYAVSQQAGQMAVVESITAAVGRTTGKLGDSLTDAQKKANDMAREFDNLQTSLGTGAARGKEAVDGMTGSLLQAVNANKEFAEGAGQVFYVGSAFVTGSASVVAFASQVLIARLAMQQMGIAGVSSWLSIARAATVAQAAQTRAALAAVAARGVGVGAAGLGAAVGAVPVAIGLAVGGLGAEAIRRRQVASGDTLAPGSFGEMLGNTWARISGGEVTEQDGMTASQRRDKMKADAAERTAAKALKDASVMPTIPGALDFGTGAAIDSAAAGGTSKGSAKSAANALQKAMKATQRAREKEAKENAAALNKLRANNTKAADDTAKAQSEIAIAQIEADFDVRRAQIEASIEGADAKATARATYQIAQMEAAKSSRVAALRAEGMKGVDELGRDTALKVSAIDTARKLTLAGIELKRALSGKGDASERDNGPSNGLAAALASTRLRGGYDRSQRGGVFGMASGNYGDGPSFVGNNAAAMAAGISRAQASFGNRGYRGDGYENRNSQTTLTASVQSIVKNALGGVVIQFAPLTIEDNDGMANAAQLFGN